MVWVPPLRSRQPALLDGCGEKAGADADRGRHDARSASCRTQQTVMFARERSTLGQMKPPPSPSGAREGGGREWGVETTVQARPEWQRDAWVMYDKTTLSAVVKAGLQTNHGRPDQQQRV